MHLLSQLASLGLIAPGLHLRSGSRLFCLNHHWDHLDDQFLEFMFFSSALDVGWGAHVEDQFTLGLWSVGDLSHSVS